jgi:hypothetical protein
MVSRIGCLFLALIAMSSSLAAQTVQESLHSPLVAMNDQDVAIVGYFADPHGIKSITIHRLQGDMIDCPSTPPSIVPCRKEGGQVEKYSCTFGSYSPKAGVVSCRLTARYRNELVTYKVRATTRDGRCLEAREVTFAVGGWPPTGGGHWLLLPILWHSGRDYPATRAVLGFARSQDYGDDEGFYDFVDDLNGVVGGAFAGSKEYATLYSRSQSVFNLWLVLRRIPLDETCTPSLAVESGVEWGFVSAAIVLHKRLFRDCASVSAGGGRASVYGGAPESPFILVHETGHCLFGLADEYGCGGWHDNVGSCRNVFPTEEVCRAAWRTCEPISCQGELYGRWRIQSEKEIMKEQSDDANWRHETLRCVSGGLHVDEGLAETKLAAPVVEREAANPPVPDCGPPGREILANHALQKVTAITFTVAANVCKATLAGAGSDWMVPERVPESDPARRNLFIKYGDSLTPIATVTDQRVIVREGVGDTGARDVTYTILVADDYGVAAAAPGALLLRTPQCQELIPLRLPE